MTDDKEVDPKVAELTEKVNSLLSELANEKTARLRAEKVNSIQKKWNDFKDDGKLDLATVEWMVENYKPTVPKTEKSNAAPAPTGGSAKLRTPLGLKDANEIDAGIQALKPAAAYSEDDA